MCITEFDTEGVDIRDGDEYHDFPDSHGVRDVAARSLRVGDALVTSCGVQQLAA